MHGNTQGKINNFYFSIHFFDNIFHQLSSAPSLLPEGVKYPLPFLPTADIKGQFGFFPPKVVKVVGNFLLRTQLKDSSDVDLDVLMPEVRNVCYCLTSSVNVIILLIN